MIRNCQWSTLFQETDFTQVTDQWELNQLIQYIKPDNEKHRKEFMY